ncbi:glycosyltransferase [Ensifer adhaerens]|uniref:glycosyltransferase n=1 Tax=Ensifer adhaerens TaxID=106592 RepID=UPI00069F81B3|nr:glycosyltransferase [Ensifer adhaerens]
MNTKAIKRFAQFVQGRKANFGSVKPKALAAKFSDTISPQDTLPMWQRGPLPVVGVVTPVRNRLTWSVSFVQQMLAQTYPFLRIYIVDAASTDGTALAIRTLGHSAVEVLPVDSSNFWTGGTNEGVRRALEDRCDYILTLNDDAVVPSEFVERLVSAATASKRRIVGSMISYAAEPGRIWGAGAYNDWSTGNFLQTKHANVWADSVDELREDLVEAECLCGNGTLIEASVFDEIGLYDVKFTPHYHADTEFTLRARQHGISSYVATNAWIYNRFYEATDGAMTARNRRYFSLRSANYLKPILYILANYCPENLRVIAFCRYIERYLFDANERTLSLFARIVFLSAGLLGEGDLRTQYFYTSGSRELDLCRDLSFALKLEGRSFLMVAAMLLLRRLLNQMEEDHYLQYVGTEDSRRIVLLDLMKRPEFAAFRTKAPEISLLLGEWTHEVPHQLLRMCSDSSFAISVFLITEKELPTTRRFKQSLSLLETQSRGEVYPSLELGEGRQSLASESKEKSVRVSVTSGNEKPTIYVNTDVLCMAQLDNRAKTGVFRYVQSFVERVRDDGRVATRLFHSPSLEGAWESVIQKYSDLAELYVDGPMQASAEGGKDIAFYPYFPFEPFDARFLKLRSVFTLCDLFPVTNPEWFTSEATTNFRRQLRHLTSARHIFCISAETETKLKTYAPTLRGTTSVAHLGVAVPALQPAGMGSRILKPRPSQRYMLCIGTLEPRKNLATVIKAMRRLKGSEFSDVQLVVVGASGWNVDFAEEANDLGDRVNFLGHVEDHELWSLYESAICTVFPSLAEGFGFPIVESFASGTPVITSNRSSMREIAGDDALLVDPLDDNAIYDAMTKILRAPDFREKLSRRGLERAKSFTWEKCVSLHVEEFLSIYHH